MDDDTCPEVIARRKLDFNGADNEIEPHDSSNVEELPIDLTLASSEERVPKINMEFDTEDAAYNFYNEYAKEIGFSIRRHTVHTDINGRILDIVFCCERQGQRKIDKRDVIYKSKRPITRTNSGAMMKINGTYGAKYKIVHFVVEHKGHNLVSPEKSHIIVTHVQASQADDLDCLGITPRASFALMSKQAGSREKVGFIFEDYKNYLHSKRTMQIKFGDTGGVLEYLQKRQLDDPKKNYVIQVDEDDLIANILWIDAQMKTDYACFGDVISFDTTHRKNKGRPFSLFVGVNHHRQTTIFGAALLYDETASTFIWLFDTFAIAMSGKIPQTVLTDQDAAMAKALATQWLGAYHRLCIWHIYQNAATHLSSVFAKFTNFFKDFRSCIYDYEEEEDFQKAWHGMLEKYGLQTNEWLGRLFTIREKWALVYGRQTFCADMTTTQRSESIHNVLKKYVNYKHNLLQFFSHFDRLINDRRYEESKAGFRTSRSTPVATFPVQILKHASSIYTHEVFELFQDELHKAYDAKVVLCGESEEIYEYEITLLGKQRSHKVFNHSYQYDVDPSHLRESHQSGMSMMQLLQGHLSSIQGME
ncbi:hypothetical protein ACS0TY_031416 [Phlomoides rotata]